MSSPWTLVGNLVRLNDETNTVRIGPAPSPPSPASKLEVVGNALVTLQDKGGNVFDVKAYGAKGDGTLDDRGAIQAAVNAMPAAGGTLYFPPGNYVVSKSPLGNWAINIENKAVLVRGAGPDSTIITLNDPTGTAHTIRTDFTQAVGQDKELYMEIRDLKFEVTLGSMARTDGAAIFQQCTGPFYQNGFTVRNCWFLRVFDGIRITNTGSATIKNCQILNCLHAAIVLENSYDVNFQPNDVGTTLINDNWIWQRPGSVSGVTHGVLVTTGGSGLRIHHNSFIGFTRPVYFNLLAPLAQSTIHIDHNSFDGLSFSGTQDPKIWITGQGSLIKIDISSNDFTVENASGVGIQVDVSSASGGFSNGTIAGNTFLGFPGPPPPPPLAGKGIALVPGAGATCHSLVLSGNRFQGLPTGIEIGARCSQIYVGENSFDPGSTPLVNNDSAPRGAFFPDRIGVGRVNDVTVGGVTVVKEIYAYSNQAFRPRVYLQGLAGTSSPAIDFAFDNTNTRRAAVGATASGFLGVQLELFTKPNSATVVQQRAILDADGNLIWTSANYTEMIELAPDPSAPAADKARLFLRDNGAGKTQLCVLFNTGAVQVLATQP